MVQQEQAVARDAVQAELARTLAPSQVDACARDRGFLSFVGEALAGRSCAIIARRNEGANRVARPLRPSWR